MTENPSATILQSSCHVCLCYKRQAIKRYSISSSIVLYACGYRTLEECHLPNSFLFSNNTFLSLAESLFQKRGVSARHRMFLT